MSMSVCPLLRGGLTVQGVPIRLELGPKDMEKESVMLARRDTGEKESVSWSNVAARVPQLLEQIQVPLLNVSVSVCSHKSRYRYLC